MPGPADDALIDIAGISVTHSTGADTINRLTSTASTGAFVLSGGGLNVATTVQVNNTFSLSGGALGNATVVAGTTITGRTGTVSAVTLNGILDMSTVSGFVSVTNGLTLNGAVNLGDSSGGSGLGFSGSQTLDGSGTIVFGSHPTNGLAATPGTLTIGPGITIRGRSGSITGTFVNQGTIAADGAGGTILLNGVWSNLGTMRAQGGGTLNLGGTFATVGLGSISTSGGTGTVNITGTLNNSGSMLQLGPATGSWNLQEGTISGGVIATAGGAALIGRVGALSGVTLNGTLDMSSVSGYISVTNGLTLNSTLNLGDSGGGSGSGLGFSGSQTLGGSGTIILGSRPTNGLAVTPGILTMGPNITIRGQSGSITGTFVNQGTIVVDSAAGTILLNGANWSNLGSMRAQGGGTLNLGGTFATTGLGNISTGGGTGTVNITGTLNNSGSTLQLGPATGSWNLQEGTISGGVIATAGGAALIGRFGALSRVTLNGTLDMSSVSGFLTVTNGLTLNSTLNLGDSSGGSGSGLGFSGSQTLGGSGTIIFGSRPTNGLAVTPGILTIGPNITIRGQSGSITGTFVNQGTIAADTAGGNILLNGANWSNLGSMRAQGGGTLNLGGSFATAGLGTISTGGGTGTVNITGTLNNSGSTLQLGPATGSWNLQEGAISGGVIATAGGAALIGRFGALSGVTLNGTLDMSSVSGYLSVTNGLTLNSTLNLGDSSGGSGSGLGFSGSQTLGGNGTIIFGSRPTNGLAVTPGILTIGPGITIRGQSGSVTGTFVNQGTIAADTAGGTIVVSGTTLRNTGRVNASSGTIDVQASEIRADDSGIITSQSPGTILVRGILLGNTRNADRFAPLGAMFMNGHGRADNPQLLEVMGRDLGSAPQGFSRNFVYGTLQVGPDTYVKLVDNSGTGRALYVNTLIVPAGSTLNLNGLHVYTRGSDLRGQILGGEVNQIAPGPITFGTPAPGFIRSDQQVDEWTVFARAGQSIRVVVSTGAQGNPPPLQPFVNFARLRIADGNNRELASGMNSQSGADISLLVENLAADGTYRLQVRAQPGNTGHYVISAWNATIVSRTLNINQIVGGQIDNPYRTDRWTFLAAAGDQVRFDLINSIGAIKFDLTGPNGYVGFRALTGSSDLLTLPLAGTYVVTAYTTGGQTGSYSMRVRQTTVTNLVLGQTYPGRLEGSGQALLFKVAVPVAKQMLVDFRDSSSGDRNELYAKYGSAPTRADYDYRYNATAANQQIVVPTAAMGDWYILVYADFVPNPSNFTLVATTAGIYLTRVTPDHAGSNTDVVLILTGSGFDRTTRVALVSDVMTYPADVIAVDLPTQITATFRAGTVPEGIYSVRAEIPGGDMSVLPNAFRMIARGQPRLVTNLVLPSVLGYHGTGTIYVDYANTGDAAMPAPLLVLDAQQNGRSGAFFTLDQSRVVQGFWTSALPDGFSHIIQILASGNNPGILQPGESVRVPVYCAGWQQPWDLSYPPINFQVGIVNNDDTESIDWNALKDGLRPPGIDSQTWDAIFINVVAQTGGTWGAYVAMLDPNAAYLGWLGLHSTDVSQLWNFNIQQAIGLSTVRRLGDVDDANVAAPGLPLVFSRFFAPSIDGRYRLGPLGRGWTWAGGWDQTLSVVNDGPGGGPGTVVIQGVGQSQRRFQPDQRGGYFSQLGDRAKLTNPSSGVYDVREQNGLTTRFRDGRIEYIEDPNGVNNRITASYTSGRLTRLAHSAGQFLQIDYNAAGRVQAVTDQAGRQTTYSYDANNEYLLSVQTFDGLITRYTYDQSNDPRKKHALLTIEHPGNTHEFFGYDAQGRINDKHRDNNAERVTFTYSLGAVAATDSTNHTTQYFFDGRGLVAKVVDPLLNPLYFAYDNAFNLTQVTDALGQVYRYRYDTNGNLVQSADPLGSVTAFTYGGPFNRLLSFTEPRGFTTQYGYDVAGNLTSITYPDNSIERFQLDSHGNPTQWTNRRQQPIRYQRDAAGRVRSEIFADGSHVDYNHDDVRDLLLSATDASGTTTLRYEDAQHPDRLTKIAYPGGRFLAFQYDEAGRRKQMTDQGNFIVKYRYDDVGRLCKLLDGSDNVIVQYTYDPTGRLRRKDNGNRTYTTYDYTETGRVQHLVNYAPNDSVNSRFDYEYDAPGRQTAMVTLEGRWIYGYDAIGQLTSVQLPNGRRIQYNYDRDGNRTSVIDNSVRTDYTSNNLNQYVTVATVTYGYDADGNLISKRDGSNLSTFTYDDKNRLIRAVTPDGTWVYEYDVFGNRRASTVNGQRIDYLIDPSGLADVVGEYNAAGGLIAHYTHGLGLTNRVDSGATASYYDFEAIGSTAGLSGASGNYVNRYSYLPFGEILSSNETLANPFTYVGQAGVMRDANGLDFMRARYYSEASGRFMTPDPIGLPGGTNFYAYVHNEPVQRIDPLGLVADPGECYGVAKGFGAAVGVSLGVSCSCGASVGPSIGLGIGPGCMGPGLACAGCSCSAGLTMGITVAGVGSGYSAGYGFGFGSCSDWTPWPEPIGPPHRQLFCGFGDQFGRGDLMGSCLLGPVPPVGSADPNEKIGPSGFGAAHFVAIDRDLPYRIDFENDARATAPAQRVDISDRLDPSLDWNTFQLTEIGFGDTLLEVPAGSRHFQASVPMTYREQTFRVEIEAGIRSDTGQVFATFQSVDPLTNLPPDVLTGFLPPEDGTGRGMGHISYTVRPKANLTTGTQIRNIALVTFDLGETIATNQIDPHDPSRGTDPDKEAWVTIDAVPPSSSVDPLPKTSLPSFVVSWAGSDDEGGSGLGFFDIFVSTDGGAFVPWLVHTTLTGAIFDGEASHTYAFYSIATDNAGNREQKQDVAEATTTTAKTAANFSVVVTAKSVTAGSPFSLTVTALDADGNVISDYAGTVHFLGSDGRATLPDDYTFTKGDAGVHTLDNVILVRAGDQWIRVSDTGTAVAGYTVVTVVPAAADHFRLLGLSRVQSGTPFDITLTALDPYDNIDINYTGTVHFNSSDQADGVVLPDDYTFTADDRGIHTFTEGVTLITAGDQRVTATDLVNGSTSSITVTVDRGGARPNGAPRSIFASGDAILSGALMLEAAREQNTGSRKHANRLGRVGNRKSGIERTVPARFPTITPRLLERQATDHLFAESTARRWRLVADEMWQELLGPIVHPWHW